MFHVWLKINQDHLHKKLVEKIRNRKIVWVDDSGTIETFKTKDGFYFKIGMNPVLDQNKRYRCLFHLEHPIACKLFYEVNEKCLDTPIVNGCILRPILPHDYLGFTLPYSGLEKDNQDVKIETIYTGTKIRFIFKLIYP